MRRTPPLTGAVTVGAAGGGGAAAAAAASAAAPSLGAEGEVPPLLPAAAVKPTPDGNSDSKPPQSVTVKAIIVASILSSVVRVCRAVIFLSLCCRVVVSLCPYVFVSLFVSDCVTACYGFMDMSVLPKLPHAFTVCLPLSFGVCFAGICLLLRRSFSSLLVVRLLCPYVCAIESQSLSF